MASVVKTKNLVVDYSKFIKRKEGQLKQLPIDVSKAFGKVGVQAVKDIRFEIALRGKGHDADYTGSYRHAYEFLQRITRWRYRARFAGRSAPHIEMGLFTGKAGSGTGKGKGISPDQFNHMGFRSFAHFAKIFTHGGQVRITPEMRKKLVKMAYRYPRQFRGYVRTDTKFIKFKGTDFTHVFVRQKNDWFKLLRWELNRRLATSWLKAA